MITIEMRRGNESVLPSEMSREELLEAFHGVEELRDELDLILGPDDMQKTGSVYPAEYFQDEHNRLFD